MSKDRFSYRVFAFRLTKEVKDKLNEARKKSGLSWNLFVRDLLHKTKDIDFSLAKEELEELEKLEKINNMNEQYKNLIEKIKEVLPKEMEQTKEESDTEWFLAYGYNQALNDCKQSLPLIFKMIQEELLNTNMKWVDLEDGNGRYYKLDNMLDKLTILNSDK